MLQLFSATWCSACSAEKKFLKDHNIVYTERDIEMDQGAYDEMLRLQIHSIPVLYLDDNNFVIGLHTEQILELAKKAS